MPVLKGVLNASPLILPCNGELDFILPELFTEIVVPDAVWQEIMEGPHLDRATQVLPKMSWLKKTSAKLLPEIIRWDLGMGETEVLSFAIQQRDYTAVLDDLLAKKCATSLGLQTIGTGTLLILAKERGLIQSVGQALRMLQQAGLWMFETVVQMLMKKAKE